MDAETVVIRNLTSGALADSALELERAIKNAQILFLPGGFSGGDEPEGSAKLIVSFFRNPRLSDAVHDLLKRRDGLMLGICNGFQALLKLGLLPHGEITPVDGNSPTLTYNLIGRHRIRFCVQIHRSRHLMAAPEIKNFGNMTDFFRRIGQPHNHIMVLAAVVLRIEITHLVQ